MRIHFTYKTVDKPWGGANNFIRALKVALLETGEIQLTESVEEPCDLMFMNQLGRGPGARGRKLGFAALRSALARDGRKLVVRAVNLNRHAFALGPRNIIFGMMRDRATVRLLEMADTVIFQSDYQREVFRSAGFRGRHDVVIHNGADPGFWTEGEPAAVGDGPLRLVSATTSDRTTKRHDLIAAVAKLPNVQVAHCGAWPEGVDAGQVRLLGKLDRTGLMEAYRQAHLFLHPAVKDPCPNAIAEAICAGLPVLYNPGPGSSAEIVGENGLALNLDDLGATVALARNRLGELRQQVARTRPHYRIERATRAYLDVFRQVAAI